MATHVITDAADLIAHCNASGGATRAAEGDTIVIPDGTYDCTSVALAPLAVTITGTSLAGTVIQGQFYANLGDIGKTLSVSLLTVDSTGLAAVGEGSDIYGANEFRDGTYRITDVRITGASSSAVKNAVTFVAKSAACVVTAIRMVADTCGNDCVSTKAPGGAELAAASLLTRVDCEAHHCGTGPTDNLISAHDGFAITDIRGYYHDPSTTAFPLAIQPDAATSHINLFGTLCVGGSVSFWIAENCRFLDSLLVTVGSEARRNVVRYTASATAGISASQNGVVIDGNDIQCATGDGANGINVAGASAIVTNNKVVGSGKTNNGGIVINTAAGGTHRVANNHVSDAYRAYYIRKEANPTVILKNNIASGSLSLDVYVYGASGAATVIGACNRLPGTCSGYALTATDAHAEGQVDSALMALPLGNCDGTGDPSFFPGVGGLDLLGRHRKLSDGRIDIGPIQRQDARTDDILRPATQYPSEH